MWYAVVMGICVVVTGVVDILIIGVVVGFVVVINSMFSTVVVIGADDVVSNKDFVVVPTTGIGCSMLLLSSGMGLFVLHTNILA